MSGMNWQDRRWDPFRDLQREMGRIFETLEPFQPWRLVRQFPAINLYDVGDHYVLSAQLPGMTAEDLDLSITGETLTMKGDRKRAEGVPDESFRRQERQFGRWMRSIALPDRIDGSQVTASFAHGILTIKLPKAESAKPRHISVTVAG
ncbi:Hsp20/alpha crystallin family protein [Singulisphaera sp. PoT]|uniref:Hsp20/alpha crystallin family protein n=1 Tax=Singulisphaera sp. PoT TaxID=3411797 RepID=UPI003BF4E568